MAVMMGGMDPSMFAGMAGKGGMPGGFGGGSQERDEEPIPEKKPEPPKPKKEEPKVGT